MGNSVALIAFAVVCGIAGQISLKMGMTQTGRIGVEALGQPLEIAVRALATPLVLGGLSLYALGAVAWMTVLSRVPLSLAYPNLALSYAFTPVLAWLLLGETIPSLRWLGIVIICIGVLVVAKS
jgi:drug/metabolite transporter (DMT)-like permease